MNMDSSYICSIYAIDANVKVIGIRVYSTIMYKFIQGPDLSKILSNKLKHSNYIPSIYSYRVFKINDELV